MLKALRALFELPESETPESLDQRLRLAAAALLVDQVDVAPRVVARSVI